MSESGTRAEQAEVRVEKAQVVLDKVERVLEAVERAQTAAERAGAMLRTVTFVVAGSAAVLAVLVFASRRRHS
jgi:DNA-binding transcriptional LysR family regulator